MNFTKKLDKSSIYYLSTVTCDEKRNKTWRVHANLLKDEPFQSVEKVQNVNWEVQAITDTSLYDNYIHIFVIVQILLR